MDNQFSLGPMSDKIARTLQETWSTYVIPYLLRFTENYIFVSYHARFTCSLYFHQVDQPKGVLPRQMYINNTGQYDKYFNAYKDLTVGLAKLLIRENNGNVSANDSYLNLAFENMLKLETKIAKVVLVLLAFNNDSEYVDILR